MKNIILLIRSHNRPEYLEQTLKSVLLSDIDICEKRYIFDDCSDNEKTNEILSNENYINVPGKEFIVFKNENNQGCKLSYIKALDYIKIDNNNQENLLICTIDNDVIVKSNFISTILNEYQNIYNHYNSYEILLTGFNPTNAHLNIIEDFGTFYRKQSCGGVNFIFHIKFLDFIKKYWIVDLDWGIIHAMRDQDKPILCLNKGILNHIGLHGLYSHGSCDVDENY